MNEILRHHKILEKLAQLVHQSAINGYQEASCKFEYEHFDDGTSSVGTSFSFIIAGERKYALLHDPDEEDHELVKDLFNIMKKNTGGEWQAFTLILDSNGRAHTQFEYKK